MGMCPQVVLQWLACADARERDERRKRNISEEEEEQKVEEAIGVSVH